VVQFQLMRNIPNLHSEAVVVIRLYKPYLVSSSEFTKMFQLFPSNYKGTATSCMFGSRLGRNKTPGFLVLIVFPALIQSQNKKSCACAVMHAKIALGSKKCVCRTERCGRCMNECETASYQISPISCMSALESDLGNMKYKLYSPQTAFSASYSQFFI
jgi:hypothetical protein